VAEVQVQVRLLGPVDVVAQGVPRPVPGLRCRALLAVLALAPGTVVRNDRLIDVVWGGRPPATSLNSLQRHVSHLRELLGGRSAVAARPQGYMLDLGDDGTDLQVATRLIEEGRRSADPRVRQARLRAALHLWRGPPLADLAGIAWLDGQAELLTMLRLEVVEAAVEARLELAPHAELVPELEELTRQHPYRERLHGQLMLALYRAGRQADALGAYRRLRRDMAENLGLEPGFEARELEAAILRQDPSLDLPPVSTAREPDPVPRQLPADVPGFTGRVDRLVELDAFLEHGEASTAVRVATISGTAGVGKTALAVHWAHRVADRFHDGQLYVNLRGFDPGGQVTDPADVVRRFLDALGVPVHRVPTNLDAQAALYRTWVAGRRLLIVLDNARDSEQVRPLLPGAPTCVVVVTSRRELSGLVAGGAHPVSLDLPTADEARDLLGRRIGVERVEMEPTAVEEIVTRCARLPLALTVVAARAATKPRLPLQALAAELHDTDDRLDVLTGDDPDSDVRAVLSSSYRALTPDAARLFRLLGLHPGPDISGTAAASLVAVPMLRVRRLLDELTGASLLVEHVPGRYAFHDLLRTYATELARRADSEDEHRAASHRLLDHYLRTAHAGDRLLYPARDPLSIAEPRPGVVVEQLSDEVEAQAWFTAELRALLASVDHAAAAGFDTHAWQLAWTMVTFLNRWGYWHELAAIARTALAAARRLDDLSAQAQGHCMRAYADTRLAHIDDAEAHLRRALELYGREGDRDGQAHCRLNLAYIWERRGGYPQALDHSRRALDLYRASGHRRGQGIALNAVGWCHARLGEYQQARECCRLALPLLVAVGDRNGQADTWDSLGLAEHHLGNYQAAIRSYRRSLQLVRQLGDHYREGISFSNLGDAEQAAGNRPAARRAWQRARTILEDLHHPDAAQVRAKLAALEGQAVRGGPRQAG
jgi:DNA-binding SARP family transcriptional activator/tetratricopeptide (TPR) repeat protein